MSGYEFLYLLGIFICMFVGPVLLIGAINQIEYIDLKERIDLFIIVLLTTIFLVGCNIFWINIS